MTLLLVAELERAAREAPAMVRFAWLVDYATTPRKLTGKGNLKLADARELLELYEHGQLEIDDLVAETWELLFERFDLDDVPDHKLAFHRRLVESGVRRILGQLQDLGIVTVTDVDQIETSVGTEAKGGGGADRRGRGADRPRRLSRPAHGVGLPRRPRGRGPHGGACR